RAAVQDAADRLFAALARAFAVPPCRVEVLAARPHGNWGELQGLYETAERGRPAKVTLWMRTARQRRVVAFRTFLRTLLHELGHHLDYQHLRLADSFHTEGFYKRESSLFHPLGPGPARAPKGRPAPRGPGRRLTRDREMVLPRRPAPLQPVPEALAAAGPPSATAMVNGRLVPPSAPLPAEWAEVRLRTPTGMVTLRRQPDGIAVVVFGNADAALQAVQRQVADAIRAGAPDAS